MLKLILCDGSDAWRLFKKIITVAEVAAAANS